MPTTSQPAAGTSLHSDWTTGLIFARNEAETTATTLAAGSMTRGVSGTGVVWGTDADGRYKQSAGSAGGGANETWTGTGFGPTFTMMVVVKWASSGGNQALLDSDGGNRRFQWNSDSSQKAGFVGFDASQNVDVAFSSSASISSSTPQAVLIRVRNDIGVYKAKLWVGATALAEVAYAGTPGSISASDLISLCGRVAGGNFSTAEKLYLAAIWDTALSDTDCDALGANGWAVYDSKSGGASAASDPFRRRFPLSILNH